MILYDSDELETLVQVPIQMLQTFVIAVNQRLGFTGDRWERDHHDTLEGRDIFTALWTLRALNSRILVDLAWIEELIRFDATTTTRDILDVLSEQWEAAKTRRDTETDPLLNEALLSHCKRLSRLQELLIVTLFDYRNAQVNTGHCADSTVLSPQSPPGLTP